MGWAVSAVNDRHLTIKALEMALKRRGPDVGLLHHADQGCTYPSEDYQKILEAKGIVCSMSRKGNCDDNAVMESFFSTVKSELGERFGSHREAKMELFDDNEVFCNQKRRHSTLGQISPAAFEYEGGGMNALMAHSRGRRHKSDGTGGRRSDDRQADRCLDTPAVRHVRALPGMVAFGNTLATSVATGAKPPPTW